ncbi:MAG: FAD:protein FMN transferase [Eubacteriales bacterium]|nr:FAD:protein FMN transferase [Eubacteriales bacterium]
MEKGKKSKIIIGIIASAVLIAGAIFAKSVQKGREPLMKDCFALDTFCTLTIYEGGNEGVLELFSDELNRLEALFSPELKGSDIWNINNREGSSVRIDALTAKMLQEAKSISDASDGALLPTIRPLTVIWNFKNEVVPGEEEILKAMEASNNARWSITEKEDGFYFEADDALTKIETGAFAKGYIADVLKERLVGEGVRSAVIDLGGNVLTIGSKPDGTPFRVGIKDPRDGNSLINVVEISDESVVTAGTYERYFEKVGRRYHHILDKSTGYPAESGLLSVTVIGKSSFTCDALATAALVLGREKAEAMMVQFPGYEIYFVEE